MSPLIVLPLFTLAALVAALITERRGAPIARAVSKALASSGFIATAIAAGAPSSSYGRALLVALGLSMAGDLLLLSSSLRYFAAGLAAFLCGHLAYCAAFVIRGVDLRAVAIAAVALLLGDLVIARWLLGHVPGRLRPAVVAYILVISAMTALAAGATVATGRAVYLVAGVAFLVSDLFVARHRFVAPGFTNRAWGLPLYYGAQILFALSAAHAHVIARS